MTFISSAPLIQKWSEKWKWGCPVMSDSLWPHGLYPTMLLRPWDFSDYSTGVGCHFLLQRIFLTQGSNPGLPYCRPVLYRLSHQIWCQIQMADLHVEITEFTDISLPLGSNDIFLSEKWPPPRGWMQRTRELEQEHGIEWRFSNWGFWEIYGFLGGPRNYRINI